MANRPRALVGRHAGTGLDAGPGSTLDVDLNELTAKTGIKMADSAAIIDSDDANSSKKATFTEIQKILGETAAGDNTTSGISEEDGVLKINITGTTANTDPATSDKLLIEVVGVNKSVTIANAIKAIGEAMINSAGATGGIAETDGVIKIDIGNVTPTTAPAPADKLLIEVTGVNKSTTITNLVKAVGEAMVNAATATSGISEVDGIIKIDIGTVTATTAPAPADLMLLEVGGVNKSASITNLQKAFGEVAAGASSDTGMSEVDGVLKIDPTDEALVPGTDYLVTHNAAGEPHKDKFEDIVALMTGNGLTDAAGVAAVLAADTTINVAAGGVKAVADEATLTTVGGTIAAKDGGIDKDALATNVAGSGLGGGAGTALFTKNPGGIAVGLVKFGAVADGDVTIGAVTYAFDVAPDPTQGEFAAGASADEAATNLAAAINSDTRNSGGKYYAATANTDTVTIYALTPGVAGNVAITRSAAEPATIETPMVGGIDPAYKGFCMIQHVVTALETDTAVLVNIPLPFTPSKWWCEVRGTTGLPVQTPLTDLFTLAASPARIVVTGSGITHVATGDVIVVCAME